MSDQSSTNGKGDGSAPSLSMLTKLMLMTTSSNDNEAMTALRKANAQADKFGGWAEILKGKITVIGDPFADAPPMPASRPQNAYGTPNPPPRRAASAAPPPPPRPQAQPSWQTTTMQQPRPARSASQHKGRVRVNMFAGMCVKCTNNVPVQTGFAITETPFNRKPKGWEVMCDPCYATATGKTTATTSKAQTGHISDLA